MDISELDAEYKKRLETVEKNFIISIKNKSKDGEASYKKDVKKIREWYFSEVNKIIKSPRKNNKKNSSKREKFSAFKLKETDIELGRLKRLKIKLSLMQFRYSIKIKNFLYALYYPFPAYFFKRVKYETRSNYMWIKIRAVRIKRIIINKIISLSLIVKDMIISSYKIPISWIKRLKKPVKKEEEKKN